MQNYRYRLLSLGFLGFFDPQKLVSLLNEGAAGGYSLLSKEISIEPRSLLFFLKTMAFGFLFTKTEGEKTVEQDWKVVCYKTNLFSQTLDKTKMQNTLNEAAAQGYVLEHAIKYPTRLLFILPREAYFFMFKRPVAQAAVPVARYAVHETPYGLFSKTLDVNTYDAELNARGQQAALKATFRDERKKFRVLKQNIAVGVWEESLLPKQAGVDMEDTMPVPHLFGAQSQPRGGAMA